MLMYPDNQQYPSQSPSPQNDPYGFIMQSPQKRGPSINPTSMKARIILVAIGAIFLIILAVIAASLLGSAGNAQKQRYIEIAQKQTEIVRISTLADKKAKGLAIRSFAVTTQLAVSSDQRKVTAALASRGVGEKDQTKLLGLGKNSKTDATLDEAEKNGRYDETFRQVLEAELTNYQRLLNTAASGANKSERPVLESSYKSATTLLAKPDKTPRPAATPSADNADLDSEASIPDDESEEDFSEDEL